MAGWMFVGRLHAVNEQVHMYMYVCTKSVCTECMPVHWWHVVCMLVVVLELMVVEVIRIVCLLSVIVHVVHSC